MTRKHRIYFFFWKIWAYMRGIRKDRLVVGMKDGFYVSGRIGDFDGESVTKHKFDITIQIKWNEPLRGNDKRYYSEGWYYSFQVIEMMKATERQHF
jgi:hypothetical protein